jgi:hypothetical protein
MVPSRVSIGTLFSKQIEFFECFTLILLQLQNTQANAALHPALGNKYGCLFSFRFVRHQVGVIEKRRAKLGKSGLASFTLYYFSSQASRDNSIHI